MTDQPRVEPRRSALERFFGGHPVNVVSKLVLLSLVVGFLMSIFGLCCA